MMNTCRILCALGTLALLAAPAPAKALAWTWSYSGTGISASGTLTTGDTADGTGFYEILAIAGLRNGTAITGLYPAGSAIPGNSPYAVDNLIRIAGPQLTSSGFGFALADGSYANPFFADFLSPAVTLEVVTNGTTLVSELPVSFTAAPVPNGVPEPAALGLFGLALAGLMGSRRSR